MITNCIKLDKSSREIYSAVIVILVRILEQQRSRTYMKYALSMWWAHSHDYELALFMNGCKIAVSCGCGCSEWHDTSFVLL